MKARLGVREPTSSIGKKATMYKNTEHKTRGDREMELVTAGKS